MTILNIYAPNISAHNSVKKIITGFKSRDKTNTIIVWDCNILHSPYRALTSLKENFRFMVARVGKPGYSIK
jgi:hypothetical protein